MAEGEGEVDSNLEPPFAAEIGKGMFQRMISEELSKESSARRNEKKQTNLSPAAYQAEVSSDKGDGLFSPQMSEGKGLAEAFLRLPENQPWSM